VAATWAIALAALCLHVPAQEGSGEPVAPSSDTIEFRWPKDLAAKVEVRVQGQRTLPELGTIGWHMSATYDLATEVREFDLLVQRTGFEGWKGELPEGVPFLADLLVDRIPTLVVSQEGAFRGIEGVVPAREAIIATFSNIPDSQRFVLENATSEAGLTAMAQDFWGTTVEAWLGFGAATGESVELRNRTAIPQLGGGALDLVIQMQNTGPAPCPVAGCKAECIELVLLSTPDQDQAEKLIEDLIRKVTSGLVPVRFELRNEFRLTIEPATTVPHAMVIGRETAVDFRDRTGKIWETSESNERTYVFDYRQGTRPTDSAPSDR